MKKKKSGILERVRSQRCETLRLTQQADFQCILGAYKSENEENLYNLGISARRRNVFFVHFITQEETLHMDITRWSTPKSD